MSVSKWMQKLRKMDGAVQERVNPHNKVVRSSSPSLNFAFGNSWGAPDGYSVLVSGPPKGGKTLISNLFIGQLHQDDPEAIAAKFDTEFRTKGQLRADSARNFGVDLDRLLEVESNSASNVFDSIESGDIREALEDGAKIRFIAIDSVNGIMGRKMENADTVDQHLVGDMAQTLQDGLKRILPIQRKYGFVLFLIAQARAEMDPNKVKYEHKVWKPAVSWAVLHHCEYFLEVAPVRGKDGLTTLTGEQMVDDSVADLAGKGEKKGHKIRAVMTDSSMGPKGRSAEFTIDYSRGLINVHEEVALLAVNRRIVDQRGAWIQYGDLRWQGVKAFAKDLEGNKPLQAKLLSDLKKKDEAGALDVPIFETKPDMTVTEPINDTPRASSAT